MTSARREMGQGEAEELLANLSGGKTGTEITNVQFAPGVRWKPAGVRGAVFRNVEWPGAGISGRFLRRGQVQECHFERVNLDSLRCQKVDFADCRFQNVTFGEHYFGNFNDCRFERCSFSACRFDAVGFVGSAFRACRFEGIKGERVRWRDCLLEDVALSGLLTKTTFVSTGFRRVDLSQAELHDSSLVYTKEADIKLPDRPDNFAIDAQLFLDAEPALREKLPSGSRDAYRRLASEWAPFGTPFIVYPGVVDALEPDDRKVVLATLYEMRHRRAIWASVETTAH